MGVLGERTVDWWCREEGTGGGRRRKYHLGNVLVGGHLKIHCVL